MNFKKHKALALGLTAAMCLSNMTPALAYTEVNNSDNTSTGTINSSDKTTDSSTVYSKSNTVVSNVPIDDAVGDDLDSNLKIRIPNNLDLAYDKSTKEFNVDAYTIISGMINSDEYVKVSIPEELDYSFEGNGETSFSIKPFYASVYNYVEMYPEETFNNIAAQKKNNINVHTTLDAIKSGIKKAGTYKANCIFSTEINKSDTDAIIGNSTTDTAYNETSESNLVAYENVSGNIFEIHQTMDREDEQKQMTLTSELPKQPKVNMKSIKAFKNVLDISTIPTKVTFPNDNRAYALNISDSENDKLSTVTDVYLDYNVTEIGDSFDKLGINTVDGKAKVHVPYDANEWQRKFSDANIPSTVEIVYLDSNKAMMDDTISSDDFDYTIDDGNPEEPDNKPTITIDKIKTTEPEVTIKPTYRVDGKHYTTRVDKNPAKGNKNITKITFDNTSDTVNVSDSVIKQIQNSGINVEKTNPNVKEINSAMWRYRTDSSDDTIHLEKYIGSDEIVNVYGKYIVDGKEYTTVLSDAGLFKNNDSITYVFFNNTLGNIKATSVAFNSMFENCTSLSGMNGLSNLDSSTVTDASYMFAGCKNLLIYPSELNTSGVTSMRGMFKNCSRVQSLWFTGSSSKFSTDNVTDMAYMFYGASSVGLIHAENFNTSKVTDMTDMFAQDVNLIELDLSSFNTSKVTDMAEMFENCKKLRKLDVSSFNTANVTNMYQMFANVRSLEELDIKSFNTLKVNNMAEMFLENHLMTKITGTKNKYSEELASSNEITLPLYNDYDAENYMWIGSTGKTHQVPGTVNQFLNCGTDHVTLVNGASTPSVKYDTSLDNWIYTLDSDAHTISVTQYAKELEASSNPKNYIKLMGSYDIDGVTYQTTIPQDAKLINKSGVTTSSKDLNKLVIGDEANKVKVTSNKNSVNSGMFGKLVCNTLDIRGLDTSECTNASYMFSSMKCEIEGLNTLDMSNVTDMNGMFADSIFLMPIDISNWNTPNVIFMEGMFSRVKINSEKVINSTDEIKEAYNIKFPENWDLSSVHYTVDMFYGTQLATYIKCSEPYEFEYNGKTYKSYKKKEATFDISDWITRDDIEAALMFYGSTTSSMYTSYTIKCSFSGNAMFKDNSNVTHVDLTACDSALNSALSFEYCENLQAVYINSSTNTSSLDKSTIFNGAGCSDFTVID